MNKLRQIFSQETVKPKPVLKNSKSLETIKHLQISEAHRKQKEKVINDENSYMQKRLKNRVEPVMDFAKFEDGFQNHLRLKNQIRKIGCDFNTRYKEKQDIFPQVMSTQQKVYLSSHKSSKKIKNLSMKELPLFNNYEYDF